MYYLRSRYYDPTIGRFISEDSYWGEDSNPLSLNLYTYAHNNPIRFIDPTGHAVLKQGSQGDGVVAVQEMLDELGYNTGGADGIYGKNTSAAVKKFQEDNGLQADGIIGNQTLTYLKTMNAVKDAPDYAKNSAMASASKAQVGGIKDDTILMSTKTFEKAIENISGVRKTTGGGSVKTSVQNNQVVITGVTIPAASGEKVQVPTDKLSIVATATEDVARFEEKVSTKREEVQTPVAVNADKSQMVSLAETNRIVQDTGNGGSSIIVQGAKAVGNFVLGAFIFAGEVISAPGNAIRNVFMDVGNGNIANAPKSFVQGLTGERKTSVLELSLSSEAKQDFQQNNPVLYNITDFGTSFIDPSTLIGGTGTKALVATKELKILTGEAKVIANSADDLAKATINAGERNAIGKTVQPMGKTMDMALNPELFANEVAKKYGINLKGSGQEIVIKFNPELKSLGKSRQVAPNVIEVGPQAFSDEKTLANTIAHELNHARSWLKGGTAPESTAYNAGDILQSYIEGGR